MTLSEVGTSGASPSLTNTKKKGEKKQPPPQPEGFYHTLAMGIPHLTRHLLPYAESVLLDGREIDSGLPRVQAVVIDGPSLVYHVYRRLLGWMDPSSDVLDYQPTCDEISRGVTSFLLQLTELGVEM